MDAPAADKEHRSRVVIADDERLIADTLRIILNQSGFEAVSAYNGADAVDLARVWPPDIFLGDVVMPGLNGIEAAILIRAMVPACRILLISGQANTANLLPDALRRGHRFDILLKPIPPAELLARLRGDPE